MVLRQTKVFFLLLTCLQVRSLSLRGIPESREQAVLDALLPALFPELTPKCDNPGPVTCSSDSDCNTKAYCQFSRVPPTEPLLSLVLRGQCRCMDVTEPWVKPPSYYNSLAKPDTKPGMSLETSYFSSEEQSSNGEDERIRCWPPKEPSTDLIGYSHRAIFEFLYKCISEKMDKLPEKPKKVCGLHIGFAFSSCDNRLSRLFEEQGEYTTFKDILKMEFMNHLQPVEMPSRIKTVYRKMNKSL